MEVELVKYGEIGIIIVMLIIAWRVIDFFLKRWLRIMDKLEATVSENTTYLKKRNGSLEENDKIVAAILSRVSKQLQQLDCDIKNKK